jgi:hypothetical protein
MLFLLPRRVPARESRKDSVEVEIEGLLVRQSTKMSIPMFGVGVVGVNGEIDESVETLDIS